MQKLSNLVIYYFAGVIVGMQVSDILSWVLHVPYQSEDRNGYNLAEVSDIQNSSMCKNECNMDYGHDIEHRIITSGKFKIEHTLPKLTFPKVLSQSHLHDINLKHWKYQ